MSRKSSMPGPGPGPGPGSGPGQRAPAEPPFRRPVVVATLSRREPMAFDISPEPGEAEAIARFLGLAALEALRFRGELVPARVDGGADGWRIEGRLTADLVQACVVTLEPVAQHIDEAIARDYVPAEDYRPPAEIDLDPEAEDDPDPFDRVIDPGLLAIESLALALDPYPRAAELPPAEYRAAPPGAAPLGEADMKPFAKLAVLKEKLDESKG